MSTSDYLLNILLIGLVVLQVRGRRLNPVMLLLPLVIVAWVSVSYLKSFPTAGNDLALVIGCAVIGAALGVGCAVTTHFRRAADGSTIVQAGVVAAVLWIIGIGSRLAFEIFATHGGAHAIGRFSVAHDITSQQVWVNALVLMAIAEVALRTGGIYFRAWRTGRLGARIPAASEVGSSATSLG